VYISRRSSACKNCFINKGRRFLTPKNSHDFIITTSVKVGEKLLDLQEKFKDKKIFFLITACDLSLNMFSDIGNMFGIPGIGVRLSGKVCPSKKAFEYAERGIKKGCTCLSEKTNLRFFHFLRLFNEIQKSKTC
jgi:hypothetical protein